ncbi:PAS domain-containing sensor histidine kinase [Thiovibrio sp. JS02]
MPDSMDQAKIFQIIKQNLPVGYLAVNRQGLVVEFNAAAEKITGYSQADVLGKPHHGLLHNSPDAHTCPLLEHAFAKRQGAVNSEAKIVGKDDREVDISVTTFPLLDEKGVFHGGVAFFRDITALKKLQRERANMLSMFAHDMKSPIVSAAGFIERILLGKAGSVPDKQRQYLEIIQNNLKNLEGLISGFLDYSRLEQKECTPNPVHLDLAELARTVIRSLEIEIRKKKIRCIFDPGQEGPFPVYADRLMMERVVANLIGNAIQYSGMGGNIHVSLHHEGEGHVTLRVADDGPGIAGEHLASIFEPFQRGNHDSKGSGLGLAITRSILACHDGKIRVDSSPGQGAVFYATLPSAGPRQE